MKVIEINVSMLSIQSLPRVKSMLYTLTHNNNSQSTVDIQHTDDVITFQNTAIIPDILPRAH